MVKADRFSVSVVLNQRLARTIPPIACQTGRVISLQIRLWINDWRIVVRASLILAISSIVHGFTSGW
jgi:hypothetical protein